MSGPVRQRATSYLCTPGRALRVVLLLGCCYNVVWLLLDSPASAAWHWAAGVLVALTAFFVALAVADLLRQRCRRRAVERSGSGRRTAG